MKNKNSEILSKNIGKGTSVWQYVVILEGSKIGENCNICSHCFIENDVSIGDNVTIKNGVQIWDGITIGNNVFIGPNVTFTNDIYPQSQRNLKIVKNNDYPKTRVCKGASIGGGATILPGVTIAESAIIGAGAVITKDVKAGTIVYGNAAKYQRNIDTVI